MPEFIGRPNIGATSGLWQRAIELAAQQSNPYAKALEGIGSKLENVAEIYAKNKMAKQARFESAVGGMAAAGQLDKEAPVYDKDFVGPKPDTMTTDKLAEMMGASPSGSNREIGLADKYAEQMKRAEMRLTRLGFGSPDKYTQMAINTLRFRTDFMTMTDEELTNAIHTYRDNYQKMESGGYKNYKTEKPVEEKKEGGLSKFLNAAKSLFTSEGSAKTSATTKGPLPGLSTD